MTQNGWSCCDVSEGEHLKHITWPLLTINNISRVSQMFCNTLVTYLFASSSYNKSSLEFRDHCVAPSETIFLPVLILWDKEFFHWSFHFHLVVEASWAQEVSHGSEQISYLPNPSAQAGYDTRSIFKQSLTGLNSEFSFS